MQQDLLLQHRYQQLMNRLNAAEVKLLAVSKYAPDASVAALMQAGQRAFGEARPQNLRDRAMLWPDCEWHMIGPLQRNKAKYIGRHAAMWHSCERIETAKTVALHVDQRELPVLIQVNISANPEQHGIRPEDVPTFADSLNAVEGLKLSGLMGMAPKHGDVRGAFRALHDLRNELFGGSFAELCMGMSNDYEIAIEEGATLVRLGSTLFADR